MSKLNTLKKLWKNDRHQIKVAIYNNIVHTGVLNILSDVAFLKLTYKVNFGKKLDMINPTTFNEKLQWLKIYNRIASYRQMVDKYEAKEYVANIIGSEYIIPTLGVWDKFEDIDFESLPEQFVLKCTHDSGSVVICRDKKSFDYKKAKAKLDRGLKNDLFWYGREWPYKNLKRRIIAEKYMEDTNTAELRDYKFFCFNGVAKCYKVDFDRFIEHKANYFTPDGDLMKLGEEVCPPDFERNISAPANLEKMKEFAERLSAEQPFLRADFYVVNGKVYFGELTFYPASGFGKFIYEGNDELLDSWIKLPEICGGGYALIYRDLLCVLNTNVSEDKVNNCSQGLSDYKIHCFNDTPKVILVCRDRFSELGLTEDFFDQDWNHLDIQRETHPNSSVKIEKPAELDKMLELAETLSKDIPFLRSDFYTIGGRVYFGELTFYPASGLERFVPESFDKKLGDWLVLPTKSGGGVLLRNDNCYVWISAQQVTSTKQHSEVLNDYKFFCFDGVVKCLYVSDSIHHKIQFYDEGFNPLNIERYDYTSFETLPVKPINFEEMKILAQRLSKGIPHLRADFYEINGKIYFGELTFFTGSGFIPFKDSKWDQKLGTWLQLPATIDK